MYEVYLTAFSAPRREHIERIVHKHNRAMSHHDYAALVSLVEGGQPQRIASFVEEQAAANVIAELVYQKASGEIRPAGAATAAVAAD